MNNVEKMMLRLLTDAGLTEGMTVLDAGSGHGNLSAMLASIVGQTGSVLGVDHDASALDIARRKMQDLGYPHVRFYRADLASPLPTDLGTFDAIVGRRVLMYLPNPDTTIQALAVLLKRGGLMIFQEMDASFHQPDREMPLHEKWFERTWRTVRSEGADAAIGRKLGAMINAAGIDVGEVRAELNLQAPIQDYPTELIARAMADRMAKARIASREELLAETDGLDARLLRERVEGWKTFVAETIFGVWGRKTS